MKTAIRYVSISVKESKIATFRKEREEYISGRNGRIFANQHIQIPPMWQKEICNSVKPVSFKGNK